MIIHQDDECGEVRRDIRHFKNGRVSGMEYYCKLFAIMLTAKRSFDNLGSKMLNINQKKFALTSPIFTWLALSLAFVLVVSVPFGHALEIHHIFSEIDHDGHQHSDSDLCQWVQQHTSNALAWDLPQLVERSWLYSLLSLANDQIPHVSSSSLLHSRGPPNFLFF